MNIRRSGGTLAVLSALAIFALAPRPAHAQLVMTTTSASTAAGGSGMLDVTLTNNGPSSADIAGFSFEVSVAGGAGITFTNADFGTTTVPYIYAGNSLDETYGLTLYTNTLPSTAVEGSDVANTGTTDIASGATFGLGELYYTVDGGASSGPVSVGFGDIGGATSLSDSQGAAPTFTANSGTINIISAATTTPEPSQITVFALFGLGLGGLLIRARKQSKAV